MNRIDMSTITDRWTQPSVLRRVAAGRRTSEQHDTLIDEMITMTDLQYRIRVTCDICKGYGKVWIQDPPYRTMEYRNCPACQGQGFRDVVIDDSHVYEGSNRYLAYQWQMYGDPGDEA